MNSLRLVTSRVVRCTLSAVQLAPSLNKTLKRFRKPSVCDVCLFAPEKRPCFNISKVSVERGNQCHAKLIRSFLYTHYWPREPSVVGLWMSLDCPYLEVLTDKYANSGDRLLAFEKIDRTAERKLIGVSVANKICPWVPDELEEWAHYTASKPERHRMYFIAHCLRKPNLFQKYGVDYIYEVEILGTAAEVSAQGVGALLLRETLKEALDARHPLVQVITTSSYSEKICEKCGMKREWMMEYTDFVDDFGQRVFFPRRPHHNVCVYVKTVQELSIPPCKPQPNI